MGRLNNSNLVEERIDSTYDNLTVLISKWKAEMRILISTARHLDRVSIQLSAGIMRENRRWRGFDCAMHIDLIPKESRCRADIPFIRVQLHAARHAARNSKDFSSMSSVLLGDCPSTSK
jgi:hypothetical protein